MPPLNNEQIQELAIADQRVASGAPGAATENDAGEVTNAGDVANLAAAGERIGASNISNIQDIALIGSGQGAPVSEGTEGPRDEYNNNQAEIAAGVANAEDNTESPNAALTRLLGERDLINTNSADDLSAIEAAGKAAGAQFDSAIGQARVDRKNILASDIVRAGGRGGFESTQQAGIAAIQRTDPTNGEAFVGQGGQLDESRQTLDRNISLLIAKQQQAIAAAKSAERKYIKTGKREDYNDSLNLIKLANDMENDKQSMANEKARLSISQSAENRAQTAEERLQMRLGFDVEKFKIGEERLNRSAYLAESKFIQDVTKEERKTTLENITNMANSLIPLDQFDDERINDLEHRAGLEPGSFEAFYDSLVSDAEQGDLIDDLTIQQKIASINRTNQLTNKSIYGDGDSASNLGFKDLKTEKSVREDVVALAQQIGLGDIEPENAFRQLRTLYAESEATDEALLGLLNQSLGIEPAGSEDIDNLPGDFGPGEIEPDPITGAFIDKDGKLVTPNTFGGNTGDSADNAGGLRDAGVTSNFKLNDDGTVSEIK